VKSLRIVVGLGNPGLKYQFTRHNIGFIVIDNFAQDMGIEFGRNKSYYSLIARGKIDEQKIILLKPQTYMNLSGKAVFRIISYYKIPLEDLLIIYDDLNLELGQVRIRKKGSSGGHKGMESIIQRLKSEDIPRLRIGIGKLPLNYDIDSSSYVLSKFFSDERDKVKEVILLSAEVIKTIIINGFEDAMREYNKKVEII